MENRSVLSEVNRDLNAVLGPMKDIQVKTESTPEPEKVSNRECEAFQNTRVILYYYFHMKKPRTSGENIQITILLEYFPLTFSISKLIQ